MRDQLIAKTRLAAIGDAAASVAYDLRNPLGAIRNAKFYLSRKLPESEGRRREYLEVMEREIVTADGTILSVNQFGADYLGYRKEEIIDSSVGADQRKRARPVLHGPGPVQGHRRRLRRRAERGGFCLLHGQGPGPQPGLPLRHGEFGSGVSSFAYLKHLAVDSLKIDGVFVKDIVDDPIDFAMVKSINEIGQVMGKKTVAEFVESDAVLEKLREIGVDFVQGYGIGRPARLAERLKPPRRSKQNRAV